MFELIQAAFNMPGNYEPSKYGFQEWACDVLGISDLENAHASDKVKMLNRSPTSNQLSNAFEDIFENIVHSYQTLLLKILAQSTRTRVHHPFVFTTAAEEAVFFIRIETLVLKMDD